MSQQDYTNLVCDQLEVLPPEMIVHRITGDGPIDLMVGPMWSVNKWEVLNEIDNELARRNSYQGKMNKQSIQLKRKIGHVLNEFQVPLNEFLGLTVKRSLKTYTLKIKERTLVV